MKRHLTRIALCLSWMLAVCSCRTDEPLIPQEDIPVVEPSVIGTIQGFYLLNQGNMGSNKATLDYFDYETGVYSRNIFTTRNPEVTMGLGDVGNDLKIYGDKLYAVINCSNLIEVMNAATATHIKAIEIPNCRYLAFADGKAYVTSYAGPVQIGNKTLGYVAEIDTTTLSVTRTCVVGYNPEEMAIIGEKMYVVNSGGYLVPDYDNTLSVIDLRTFTEEKKIELTPNMKCIRATVQNQLIITSRGNYNDVGSDCFLFDPETESLAYDFGWGASNLALQGDNCLLYAWEYDARTGDETVSYRKIKTSNPTATSTPLITDDIASQIAVPYCIAVNPENKEFMIGDAADYVSPGTLYYFNADGTLKWKVTTGDIPAAIAFKYK
ncbi:MAG: YncE family protein [Paludibacteraceae bacterium]|nr:YncE family protein [Paludibacteraceae bacterium]